MTRDELSILSQAHALALTAMCVHETGHVPVSAALHLARLAETDMPAFAPICQGFHADLIACRGDRSSVFAAGARFRDAVVRALEFRPCDAGRADIHG